MAPDRNNAPLHFGAVELSADSLVDLSGNVVADPKVDRSLSTDESHRNAFSDDANFLDIINPNCGPILHLLMSPNDLDGHAAVIQIDGFLTRGAN